MPSKHFKNKTAIQLPDSAKSELPPREQADIDKEYTQLCISIGDRTVKAAGLDDELQQMLNYARRLGNESAKRQELNKNLTLQEKAANAKAAEVQSELPTQTEQEASV